MRRKLIFPVLAILLAGSVNFVEATASSKSAKVSVAATDYQYWYKMGYKFGRIDAIDGEWGDSFDQPPSNITSDEWGAFVDGYSAGWYSWD